MCGRLMGGLTPLVWMVLGSAMPAGPVGSTNKVPVLGDLPMLGRLFRSENHEPSKKNLLIFVTPTLIDPAGNRPQLKTKN